MLFRAKLIEVSIVKTAEFWRQAAERPNQRELGGDKVDDKAEPSPLRVSETNLGFVLHFQQPVTGEQKIRVMNVAGEGCVSEVSNPVRRLECATHQLTATPNVFRPTYYESREAKIRSCPESY